MIPFQNPFSIRSIKLLDEEKIRLPLTMADDEIFPCPVWSVNAVEIAPNRLANIFCREIRTKVWQLIDYNVTVLDHRWSTSELVGGKDDIV
jgi:hypothetical protein